ncbi:hypothetical protein KSP39_PZI004265 [Platanthera zijinensis]|uniref:Uncharacterized protein n=1 Tax=Platanthera zijinensis TaxID=2320716 RepID=A0AAP0BUY7_9ASPA
MRYWPVVTTTAVRWTRRVRGLEGPELEEVDQHVEEAGLEEQIPATTTGAHVQV